MEQAGSVAQRSEAGHQTHRCPVDVFATFVPAAAVESAMAELKHAEGAFGLKLRFANAKNSDEVPAALVEIEAERPDALMLTSGGARSLYEANRHGVCGKASPSHNRRRLVGDQCEPLPAANVWDAIHRCSSECDVLRGQNPERCSAW